MTFDFMIVMKTIVIILALYGALRLFGGRTTDQMSASLMWALQHAPNGLNATELEGITGVALNRIYPIMARLTRQNLVTRSIEGPNNRFVYRFNPAGVSQVVGQSQR